MRPQTLPPGSSPVEPNHPTTEEGVHLQTQSVGSPADNISAPANHEELQAPALTSSHPTVSEGAEVNVIENIEDDDHDIVDAEDGGAPLYDIDMEGSDDETPVLPLQSASSGIDTVGISAIDIVTDPLIQAETGFLNNPATVHPQPEPQPDIEEQDAFGFNEDVFQPYPFFIQHPGPGGLTPDNFHLLDFLLFWRDCKMRGQLKDIRGTPSNVESVRKVDRSRITYEDLNGDECDLQGINWRDIGVTRTAARKCRTKIFRNYTNRPDSDAWDSSMPDRLPRRHENYFRFRSMDLKGDVRLLHFQLRNILGCASRTAVYYPCTSGTVRELDPTTGHFKDAMKFKNTDDALVSTLTAEEGILMTGGFHGTYRYRSIGTGDDASCYDGRLTDHVSGITNHVQVNSSRRSSTPLAAFASNDYGFRMVDLARNEIVLDTMYDHALNCTTLSPDKRLRVMVGDLREVLITDAETGQVLQCLEGHRDFGFACDWASDGWTIATGNQDKTIRIWDARMWKDTKGKSLNVAVIRSEMAGVRSLRFSPLGSGKRLLLAAEEADVVNIIDAQTFDSKQTIDVIGELAGVSFTNAGQEAMVLSSDPLRGGVIRLERCDHGVEDTFSYMRRQYSRELRWREPGYDWLPTPQQVVNHPQTHVTLSQKQRQAAMAEDWFF
ncbi:WD40-repeat-containing domain protein [Xylaria arbuscula]|nr:WD40-repeat-containing domain protein [Xylaria arbuscula]